MDLTELSVAMEKFIDQQGVPHTEALHGLIVAEEAGEVARAVLKGEMRIRGSAEFWHAELVKELAGVITAAAACAGHYGIDLEAAVSKHLAELEALPVGALLPPRPPNT